MILIGLGANLSSPDGATPRATVVAAAEALRGLSGLRLAAMSRCYRSAPVLSRAGAPTDQPPYVNAVARLEGNIDPSELLRRLHMIEAAFGRVREAPDGPRTLDLDIIAMDDLVRGTPDPVLPHPRAHQRAFVLLPLAEVAPGWLHPRLHQTVEDLLAALPPQEIALL